MRRLKLILTGVSLMFSGYALGAKAYSCKNNSTGEVREIKVVEDNPGQKVPCKVLYVKAAVPEEKFSAKNEADYCDKKADVLKGNLEAQNAFSCTAVAQ